eukprot:m.37851 g.37851  ORF g.37851 m.37851 type:complete len:601 (+) comp10161_c0_seq2:137-1939(+)
MTQARALYDFDGATEGEVNLHIGDVITVLRQDIGEGWWEGQVNGQTGIFPASYVEVIQQGGMGQPMNAGEDPDEEEDDDSDWDSGDDGDDWDDDGDGDQGFQQTPAYNQQPPTQSSFDQQPSSMSSSSSTSQQVQQSYGGPISSYGRSETLKRSVNRFSVFVKAGAEDFLLGATKEATIKPQHVLHMEQSPDGPAWLENDQPYPEINVQHDGSRKKFKGMKSYEAYNVSNAAPGINVERRFKHFVWLHDRLENKYACICVPPLPGKDYNSKFGETMVDKRQLRLKMWLNRVCRHPILSRDALALSHFLTSPTSDKAKWKNGKRKAEKDTFVGAMFFKLISQDVPCPNDSDKEIEQFEKFVSTMSKCVKRCTDISGRISDHMAGTNKNDYLKFSSGLESLGKAFSQSGGQVSGDSVRLSGAFVQAASFISNIADLYCEQPKFDQIPWMEGIKEYAGILNQFSGCITSSRSASIRVEEIENNETATPEEKTAVTSRCDVIHTLTLCEMSHFHKQRRSDFKDMMTAYFSAQIAFHQKVMCPCPCLCPCLCLLLIHFCSSRRSLSNWKRPKTNLKPSTSNIVCLCVFNNKQKYIVKFLFPSFFQ